jgi:hypothetical protein
MEQSGITDEAVRPRVPLPTEGDKQAVLKMLHDSQFVKPQDRDSVVGFGGETWGVESNNVATYGDEGRESYARVLLGGDWEAINNFKFPKPLVITPRAIAAVEEATEKKQKKQVAQAKAREEEKGLKVLKTQGASKNAKAVGKEAGTSKS